jgi:hypothetical protein
MKGILNFLRLRAAALHTEQTHDRRKAVLDAVAHLSNQHGLVVEGLAEIDIGVLALDGDAEEIPGRAQHRSPVTVHRLEIAAVGRARNLRSAHELEGRLADLTIEEATIHALNAEQAKLEFDYHDADELPGRSASQRNRSDLMAFEDDW